MNTTHYDAIIIGSGPAGEGAAMRLAKGGRRVAMVEKHSDVGGGCTHWATIPSKTLRHNIQMVSDFRRHPLFRRLTAPMDLSFADLVRSSQHVIHKQSEMREHFYHRNQVDLMNGAGRFVDPHTLEIELNDGGTERRTAEHFVIATGSCPYRPDNVDFNNPRIRDSDSILGSDLGIRSITIYGAGVIGCEYASIFGSLGLKVNLVNTRERLLSFLDTEITDALGYHLRDQGVVVRHNEEYEKVEADERCAVLHCNSGKRFKSDVLLWANGRSGNSRELGIENAAIEADHRGQLKVNEDYQTAAPHIYAVGDVVGLPALASASYDQGRFAATHILEGKCDQQLVKNIPTGIYTNPEISSIGPTESELTERKIPYEVGRAFFRSIARAQMTGHTTGMVKILFHIETLEILGIHCFGQQAAEIIHIGQAIMSQQSPTNNLKYFVNTTFNYPTMAEAYRVAALNGLNRIF